MLQKLSFHNVIFVLLLETCVDLVCSDLPNWNWAYQRNRYALGPGLISLYEGDENSNVDVLFPKEPNEKIVRNRRSTKDFCIDFDHPLKQTRRRGMRVPPWLRSADVPNNLVVNLENAEQNTNEDYGEADKENLRITKEINNDVFQLEAPEILNSQNEIKESNAHFFQMNEAVADVEHLPRFKFKDMYTKLKLKIKGNRTTTTTSNPGMEVMSDFLHEEDHQTQKKKIAHRKILKNNKFIANSENQTNAFNTTGTLSNRNEPQKSTPERGNKEGSIARSTQTVSASTTTEVPDDEMDDVEVNFISPLRPQDSCQSKKVYRVYNPEVQVIKHPDRRNDSTVPPIHYISNVTGAIVMGDTTRQPFQKIKVTFTTTDTPGEIFARPPIKDINQNMRKLEKIQPIAEKPDVVEAIIDPGNTASNRTRISSTQKTVSNLSHNSSRIHSSSSSSNEESLKDELRTELIRVSRSHPMSSVASRRIKDKRHSHSAPRPRAVHKAKSSKATTRKEGSYISLQNDMKVNSFSALSKDNIKNTKAQEHTEMQKDHNTEPRPREDYEVVFSHPLTLDDPELAIEKSNFDDEMKDQRKMSNSKMGNMERNYKGK